MELNFSLTSLLTDEWDIKEKRIEKFKNKNWQIYTFHAGHESKLEEFRDAYTSLSDDDKRSKDNRNHRHKFNQNIDRYEQRWNNIDKR